MDENVILNIGLFVFVGGFILLVIKYLRHFKKLRKAYLEAGIDWPMPNRNASNSDFTKSNFKKVLSGPYKLLILIIFNKHDNVLIQESVRGIRYTLLLFAIFPFALFFILIILLSVWT